MKTDLKNCWALITGASSGLGVDFARELARRGCHLVLVARREELMKQLQSELQQANSAQVVVVAMDLSLPDAPERLHQMMRADGRNIDILINNAGFGLFGNFLDLSWERQQNMLALDMMTLSHMTHRFGRDMRDRGFGYILQLSSIGGYQPSPLYAAYAAAKAYVLNFSEAIAYELRHSGVSCTVLSPGITATEFLQVSGQKATFYQRLTMMTSPDVARVGIEAMLKRKPSLVPGIMNKLGCLTMKLIPRRLAPLLAYQMMRNH